MSNTDDDMQGRKLPRGVYPDRDRHGNIRLFFRKGRGKRVRIFSPPGTREFEEELALARMGVQLSPKSDDRPQLYRPSSGTLDWLIDCYEKRGAPLVSVDLAQRRLRMLREVADWTKNGKRRGELPFAGMARRHVVEIRDAIRDTAGARNNVTKAISAMFAWAIEAGIATDNPATGIKRMKSGDGFHAWTRDEVNQFLDHHPEGSMARRAINIFLFSGLRLADAAILGRQHLYQVRNRETGAVETWMKIMPAKTSRSSAVVVDIPVLPDLQAEIDRSGNGMTFLLNEYGAPYSTKGLGNKMRQWCDEAGLPHCSAHGLRKAGATIAVENGADYELLKAVFGWTTAQQASHYVQSAQRRRIAANAGKFLKLDRNQNK